MTHIVFTPHELIEKLIPLIPRPRCHLVRYHGILGPVAKDRAKVVPTPPAPDAASAEAAGVDKAGAGESREIDITKPPRVSRLPWALLLRRVFMTDALTCPKCQGRMKILAAIAEPGAIRKILDHLGIPSEAPRRRPARPPPQTEFPGGDTDAFYADPPAQSREPSPVPQPPPAGTSAPEARNPSELRLFSLGYRAVVDRVYVIGQT